MKPALNISGSRLGVSTVVYQMILVLMVTATCFYSDGDMLPQFSAQDDAEVDAYNLIELN